MLGQPFPHGAEPSAPGLEAVEAGAAIPACSVCGRQDDTLRIAVLPYVISVIFITFRRAFVGLWCRRHRNIKLLQASAISAFVGWIGIPYGLLYTPVVLWKLSRGGDQPVDANTRMLKALGEHKLKQGDVQAAARCFETVLQLSADDEEAVRRLSEIYRKYPDSLLPRPPSTFLSTVALILAGFFLGGLLGSFDFIITRLLSPLSSMDSLVALLSWIPFVGTVFLGGVLLAQGIEMVYRHMSLRQNVFGAVVAVLTAFVAIYGITEGYVLVEFLESFLTEGVVALNADALKMLGALTTRGGAWFIRDTVHSAKTPDVIYLILLAVALIFYTGANLANSRRITGWQGRLHTLRPRPVSEQAPAFLSGWIAVVAVPMALILLGVAFGDVPPVTRINTDIARFIDQGDELFDRGDLEGAARAYEQAAQLDPQDAWSRVNLGWAYYWQGQYEDAMVVFQEAVRLGQGIMEAHLGLGFSASPLGEYSLAQQHFEIVIENAENATLQSQAYYGLADVYALMGVYDRAIETINKAIEIEPKNAYLHINLGWYRFNHGQYDLALGSFEQALQLEPGMVDALVGIAYVDFAQEEYKEAREGFLRIINMGEVGPSLINAQLGVGRCSYFEGEFVEATPYYEKALAQEPNIPIAWIELTLSYIMQGEFDTALEKAQALVDLQPDSASGYVLKAIVYHFNDQLPLMQQMQDKAFGLYNGDENATFLLYYLLSYTHQFARAEALLDEAYQDSDYKEDILIDLVHVYVDQQKLEQARQTAEELKALEGESLDYHLLMADIASETLEWDQTLVHLEHALALDEEDFRTHNFYSYVYFNLGRMEDALYEAQEAVRQFPYSASTFKNLAFAHHALGEIDQAVEAARESLRLDPKYDLGYYILGLCYEDTGNVEKAREAFESFLELYWERANVNHFKEHAQAFLEGMK